MSKYSEFLNSKRLIVRNVGIEVDPSEVHASLTGFRSNLTLWALRKGRAAIFADTGLGKTRMQIEWGRLICKFASVEYVLIVAPLSVVQQTVSEGLKIDVTITPVRSQSQVKPGLNIINYEMLDHIDASVFGAVILDESSCLKNMTGKVRNQLVKMFKDTPYKLCCTATPAPNDISELGNHAEFLGIMTTYQMTATFFVHDAGVFEGVKESRWRLKGHARKPFFRWLASWGIACKKPSDLGYSDDGFELPPLSVELKTVASSYTAPGMLPGFMADGISAIDARKIRRVTLDARIAIVAEMVNASAEQWILWTGLNDEADALVKCIPDAINVEGSMSPEAKSDGLVKFTNGQVRVLVTKSSIAGFGINMQNCHNMMFVGLDYSWEAYYQSIRRVYRFGQLNPVKVTIVTSEQERPIYQVIMSKEKEAMKMTNELIQASSEFAKAELGHAEQKIEYKTASKSGNGWMMMLGDSTERMSEIASDSVHLSVYSPPFSDMYVYQNTERDLSNSANLDEFFTHYSFIIRENLRITMPGRIACVHIQDPKTFQNREGFRGLRDLSGMLIDAYQREGWIFRSRITIDKNPQIVASRNKDTDLLFITGKRDSADLAPMATDYLMVFKKPGDNPVPVLPYANHEMTEDDWISWAHAVWYDIRETDVLNVHVAKGNDDAKHMCPLQLPLIRRCLKLWSNPHETIFSPFGGIGSEGYEAILNNRQFIGIELKEEYFNQAVKNLNRATTSARPQDLFAFAEQQQSNEDRKRAERDARDSEILAAEGFES